MNITAEDVDAFVRFILLDETARRPSRWPNQPMKGFWMSRWPVSPTMLGFMKLRVSDKRLRRHVCLQALIEIAGETPYGAAVRVTELLGLDVEKDTEGVRVDRHNIAKRLEKNNVEWSALFEPYWYRFLGWREWVVSSTQSDLDAALALYAKTSNGRRVDKLRRLIDVIRRSEDHLHRNRAWWEQQAAAIESWMTEGDGVSREYPGYPERVALLARLRYNLGQPEESIRLMTVALESLPLHRESMTAERYTDVEAEFRRILDGLKEPAPDESERPTRRARRAGPARSRSAQKQTTPPPRKD